MLIYRADNLASTVENQYNETNGTGEFCLLYHIISVVNTQYKTKQINVIGTRKSLLWDFVISDPFIYIEFSLYIYFKTKIY